MTRWGFINKGGLLPQPRGFAISRVSSAAADETRGTRDLSIGYRNHEVAVLVVELQTHLQLAFVASLACDLAIIRIGVGIIWSTPDNVVKEVERFGSEFKVSLLSESCVEIAE
jgi:hypothetical protein